MNLRQSLSTLSLAALVVPAAFGFEKPVDPAMDSPLAFLTIGTPVSPQQKVANTFSRNMREAMQETHDSSKTSVFGESVAAGKLTGAQYTIALKQNLATFEAFQRNIDKSDLPADLKAAFDKDLKLIIEGFRDDLGMKPGQQVSKRDLLGSTRALIKFLGGLKSHELAACAYEEIGGNAFGTHEIAENAKNKCGLPNVKGYTMYTFDQFKGLIAAMNKAFENQTATFDPMVDAAKKFFKLNKSINDSKEFAAHS